MLLPKQESIERAGRIHQATASVDFGPARVERQGKAAVVHAANNRASSMPRTTTRSTTPRPPPTSAILDPQSEICVLRGGRGRSSEICRPQGVLQPASISRTSIAARFPFLWYILRDMGFVNKMFRGLAMGRRQPRRSLRRHAREAVDPGGRRPSPSAAAASILLAMDYMRGRLATPT